MKINRIAAAFLICVVLALSCKKEQTAEPDPWLVSAVSSGVLGRTDPVVVTFTQSRDISTAPDADALVLQPAVKGTVAWLDGYTLAFTPSEPYKAGQRYQVDVRLPGAEPFGFSFMTALPYLEVSLDPLQIDANGDIRITGSANVDADAEIASIEETITSEDLGEPAWEHDNGVHRFTFDAIQRADTPRVVIVNWDGKALGSSAKGNTRMTIPGQDVFEVLSISSANGAITVSFTSPLKITDLRGFISLSGKTDVRYSLVGNIIRVFGDSEGGVPSGAELVIQDIEDIDGRRLTQPVLYTVPETWELPEVRIPGTGTLLPTTQGAQLVVETRNLAGLLIEAYQIYGDNMLQFLQVNNLDGTRELDRVGEPVWTKALDFSWTNADQNRWIRRGLDVSELSKMFPGGMFHIRVSFRPRHIKYECSKNHGDFSHMTFPDDSFPSYNSGREQSYWDNYYYLPEYNWSEWRAQYMDPCHPAFYIPYSGHNITVNRNVLVSDLGLLAKKSLDGSWLIAATNLITARHSPNTDFSVLNYQGKVLYQGKIGPDGMATLPPIPEGAASGARLVIYAENSLGKAYLKINDSLTLATSHFDVSGASPSTGIKGLIYGERGVWRPGDDIFLTFLLADSEGTLPSNHPVSFELEDPRGRVTLDRTYTSSVDGFYAIEASTAPDAPTGDWIARVRVGGAVFTKDIKIETVMPNRLKMNLDFGGETIRSLGNPVSLAAEWLYGAPAPGLKADVSVTFEDRETAFPGYAEYSFRDPSRRVSFERQTVWQGNLNQSGTASFPLTLNPGTAVPGKVTSRFMTRVFEPSGVFSSEQVSVEYSPYRRYIGLRLPRGDASRNMLLTDTDHKADIVVLDEDGKPVTDNVTLECSVYEISWRWWWEKGMDEAAEFTSILSRNPVSRQTVTAVNGKASFTFNIKYPEWGRYLVMVSERGGHAAAQIAYIDWPGWAGRSLESGQGAQTTLALTSEKPAWNVGEKVKVSFPSNKEAAALVVVEKGGEIIKREWLACADGVTNFEFDAEPSLVPNVYVHVTLIQPHLQTQNDLPIRLYGITPITIDDANIALHPVLTVPENWDAESTVSFSVSEASGRPMAYTVAVVDEGLVGLTRYSLPNPKGTFYAREASFLKSWDLFQEVIGAFSGTLETLLAIGGGDDEMMDTNKETQRFKPVVRFFGPFELAAGETKTETFDLPAYTGALRVMVMAASSTGEARNSGSQRAYGTAEASVKVTSDLMVFASLPRVLSPNDEVEVPVYVNSFREGNRNVRVSLSVLGAVVEGPASQEVAFDKSEEKLIRFRVKAPANPGALQFTVRADSAGLKTAQHVTDMEVRSTALPVTASAYSLIGPNETWQGTLAYPGRDGTNELVASFSRLPPLNLESRLGFLVRYPHGCAEQTTSAVFPQLYLDKLLDLDAARLAEIRTNVNAGIERLGGFQLMSGGFSYWPGEQAPNDWASSYIGHFLLEARRLGYTVKDSVIKSWLHYQKNTAALWQAGTRKFTEQAYRLYTIALAGEADLGSMNRLREQRNMPLQAQWRLAAAYWYAGQRDTARNMIRNLSMPQGDYRELSGTFGSGLRDKAMILETLILLNAGQGANSGDLGRTRVLFEEIAAALSSDRWLSTQETAYALIAMSPYIQANAGSGELRVDYSAQGSSPGRIMSFDAPSAEEPIGPVSGTSGPFVFVNRSAVPVYVRLTARGLPDEGSEPALSQGLALSVLYRDSSGRTLDPAAIKTGEDVEVRVTVRNSYSQTVEELAVIIPVPASWEIINTRLGAVASGDSLGFRYQDIRDDRVMTYFNLDRGQERTISFRVNKTYEGAYYRPAIHAYAMYDESIRALVPGVRLSGE